MSERNWKRAAKSWRQTALRYKRLLEESRQEMRVWRKANLDDWAAMLVVYQERDHWRAVADERLEEWRKAEQQRDGYRDCVHELETRLRAANEGLAERQGDIGYWADKAQAADTRIATLEGLLREVDRYNPVEGTLLHTLRPRIRAALSAAATEPAPAGTAASCETCGYRGTISCKPTLRVTSQECGGWVSGLLASTTPIDTREADVTCSADTPHGYHTMVEDK